MHRVLRQRHRRLALAHHVAGVGKMRRARDHVGTDIVRQVEVIAREIGHQQRGVGGPPFMLAVGLHHLGAGHGLRAAAQQAVGLAGDRIAQRRIGEREQVGLPGRVLRMAGVAAGQAEADVGGHSPCACDMRHQPVEHDAALQILVEAEMEEVAQEAAGLRDAEADRAAG